VFAHHGARRLRVPVEHRLDERGVLMLRVLQVPHEQRDAVQQVVHGGPDGRVLRGQRSGAGQLGQCQMQKGVAPAVVGQRCIVCRRQSRTQPFRALVRQPVRGAQVGRAGLQHLTEAQDVLDIDGRHPAAQLVLAGADGAGEHERAAVPPSSALHQPLVLQHLQHLAQRDPADPEQLGQVALGGQPLATGHQAEPDHLEDLFERLLEAVARAHGPQHGAQLPRGPVPAGLAFLRHVPTSLPNNGSYPYLMTSG
jgi:hypothetical protein